MRSIRSGETPVLMTCAPMPHMMPPPRFFAATMALTTRRTSAAPSIPGSESSQVLNDAPRAIGLAKSSACALLRLDANGYVRTPDRSNSSYGNAIGRSDYQHRVAVAVEPIAALDGFAIGGQDPFLTGECRHQHQQRRAG